MLMTILADTCLSVDGSGVSVQWPVAAIIVVYQRIVIFIWGWRNLSIPLLSIRRAAAARNRRNHQPGGIGI